MHVSISFGCIKKYTDKWLEQQTFIFPQFWCLEDQDQVEASLVSAESALSGLQMATFSLHPFMALPLVSAYGKSEPAPWGFFF